MRPPSPDVGRVEYGPIFRPAVDVTGSGVKPVTGLDLPSIEQLAGTSKHVPLNADDQLVELLGGHAIATTIQELPHHRRHEGLVDPRSPVEDRLARTSWARRWCAARPSS